ncbi:hypothetical protein QBC38DRAFT_475915 [Podospora fimiseda]|uniref:F-box domain-containing protein n=1 Tax=Podospora fimiseda TaxID=252190 RepID=A0AAN7H042_9PEZI|nr:hypothetical protein QBC38DRAFT_475915 [Podospora fimiseda]
MMASFNDVPDEIIRHILHFIPPEHILDSVQLVSNRFYHVAREPLLWKWFCMETFKYWHPAHSIEDRIKAPAPQTDWKALWIIRAKTNAWIAWHFEGALTTNQGRLKRIEHISSCGFDAKDYLLEQIHCDDSRDDVLCRRYYANAALNSLHKSVAIDLWYQYQGNPLCIRGLDRALAAFDLCVSRDQPYDIEYVVRTLDEYADWFKRENSEFDSLTTRQKTICLVRWLRRNKLVGLELPDLTYRNLKNCFIGHALSDESHPAIPLISSAIFVCVAERLGMVSTCVTFPSHVHAAVFAPPDEDGDGNLLPHNAKASLGRVYVDPYGSDNEVTVAELRSKLSEIGWTRHTETLINPAPVPIVVQRTARNIKTTWNTATALRDHARSAEICRLRTGLPPGFDLDAAYYTSLWADLLARQADTPHWDVTLDDLLARISRESPEDIWLVKRYISPMYDRFIHAWPARAERSPWRNPHKVVEMIENIDARQPEVSRRYTEITRTNVRYKIGDVFRHKRYRYIGIINGWSCPNHNLASTLPYTVTPEDVHDLSHMPLVMPPNGQQMDTTDVWNDGTGSLHGHVSDRVYYTCMRPGYDHLRLSQNNVEIIKDPDLVPEQLFVIAGKCFKRFDREMCTFVSNIKESYPDD